MFSIDGHKIVANITKWFDLIHEIVLCCWPLEMLMPSKKESESMLEGKKEPCTNLWHGFMKIKIQTYANVHKVSGHL